MGFFHGCAVRGGGGGGRRGLTAGVAGKRENEAGVRQGS